MELIQGLANSAERLKAITELALGGKRKVVMEGSAETYCKEADQENGKLCQKTVDLSRRVGIPVHALTEVPG